MTDPWSISALRQRFVEDARPLPRDLEAQLRSDPRAGVQAVLAAVDARRRARRAEGQRRRRMLRYERDLWARSHGRVAGVDEAGMSPWAGPVVAAAVILPADFDVPDIDDSKRLTAEKRDSLAEIIKARAIAWATGSASPEEVGRFNLHAAGLLAMRRAVVGLRPTAEALIVDARTVPGCTVPQVSLIRGDQLSYSVAAASILAKTTRDRHMARLDALYPGYGLAQHKGYGVPEHRRALRELGPCPIHRLSFDCVQRELDDRHCQSACKTGELFP